MARIKTRFEEMVNDLNDGEKEMLMELMFGRTSSVSANLSSTLTENDNFNNSTTINEDGEDNNSVEPDLLGEEDKDVNLIYVGDDDDESTTRKKTDGPPPMAESAVGAGAAAPHHVDTFRSGASVTSSTTGGGTGGFAPGDANNNNDHHSIASDSRNSKSLASGSAVKPSSGGGGPSIVKFSTKRSRDVMVANRLEGYLTLLREDYIYKRHVQANQSFAASSAAEQMSDTTSIKSGVSSSAGGGIKKRPSTSESFTGTTSDHHNNDVPLQRHSSRTILSTLKSILSLVNTPSIKDEDESPLSVLSSTLPRTMLCFLHKDGIFLIMQYIKPQDIIASTTKTVSSSVEADRIRQATVAVSILRCLSYQLSSRRQHLLLQEHKSIIHILNCMNYYTIVEDEPQHEWSKKHDRAEGEAFMEEQYEFFNVSDQMELRSVGHRRTTHAYSFENGDNDDDEDDQSSSAKSDSRKGGSSSKKTKSKDSATNSVLSNGSNNSAATAAYHAATVRNLKERKTLHEECIRAMYCLAQKATTATPPPEPTAATPTPATEATAAATAANVTHQDNEPINESSASLIDQEIPGEVTTSPSGDLSLFAAPAQEEEEETATIQFLTWKRKYNGKVKRGGDDDATTTCSSLNFGKHTNRSNDGSVVGGTGDALLMVMKELRIFFYKTSSVQKYSLGLFLQIFRDIHSFYHYMNRRTTTTSSGPMVVTLRMNHDNGGIIGADHRDRDNSNYLKPNETNHNDEHTTTEHAEEENDGTAETALTSWQKIAPVSMWNQFICYIVNVVMRYNKYASDSTTAAAITTTNASSAGTTTDNSTSTVSSSVEIIQLGLMVIQRSVEIITHDVTLAILPDVFTADHYALNSSNVSLDSGGNNNNRRSWNHHAYSRKSKTSNGNDENDEENTHENDNDDHNEAEQAYITTTMMHYMILGEPNIEECIINILREHPRNLLLIVQCMVVLHCLCTIGSTSAAASTANAMYGGAGAVVVGAPGQPPARDSSGSIASQNTLTTTTPPPNAMQPRRGSNSGCFTIPSLASSIRHVARETLAQSQHLMVLVRLLNKHKNEVLIQREGLKLLRTLQNLSSQCFIPPVPDFFWNVPMHQTILKRAYLYGKVHRGRSYTTKQLQLQSPPPEIVEEEAKIIEEATKQEYHMYYENYIHVSYDIGIDDDDSSNEGSSYNGDATSSICSSSIVGGGPNNAGAADAAAAPLKFVGNNNATTDHDEQPLSKAALRVSAIQSRSRVSKSKEAAKKKKQQLQAALLEQVEKDQEQSLGGISNASPLSQAGTTTTPAPKKRGPTISFFKRKKDSSSTKNTGTTNNNNKNISVSLGGQLRKK